MTDWGGFGPPSTGDEMKFRNDNDRDIFTMGTHFAIGATVEVSDDLAADKVAYLKRMFTLVEDEPPAPEPDTSIFDTPPPTTKRKRRTKRRFD